MLTNRINVTYNIENIDADFDIFRVEKANKDYYKYNILDSAVYEFKAAAVQWTFGATALVLFRKGEVTEKQFKESIMKEYEDVKIQKIDLFDSEQCNKCFYFENRLLAQLLMLGKEEAELLSSYLKEIVWNDTTNREGHAAKVYFNALFGLDFTRTEDNNINAALNYGYSIILSTFTREIAANGYITQLGLFHDNMFNQFNLASDLMEPFRVLVDREVKQMKVDSFEHDEKMQLVNILNQEVSIDGRIQYVNNAIKIYCKSVFDALNDDDSSLVRFYRFEL